MARVEGLVEWRLHLGVAKRYRAPEAPFARTDTASDIELLVEMGRANEYVCGPAIGHLVKRAYNTYGDKRYERLAKLSVSHLYNLRKSSGYQVMRVTLTKTRPVCNPIGVRKTPRPNGRAGWVRIDSVHQGEQRHLRQQHNFARNRLAHDDVEGTDAVAEPMLCMIPIPTGRKRRRDRRYNLHHRRINSPAT